MGGHENHERYTIPDYRIYKVENCPKLMAVQRALAAVGLKDPWLRNEVWRYDPKHFGTERSRLIPIFFRGFRVGFIAFVVTIAGTAVYDKLNHSEHGDGHGHH